MTWPPGPSTLIGAEAACAAGAIAIEASGTSSTPTLKLTSRTFTSGASGTYGQGVPNVGSANLQTTIFLTGLESDADYRTNLGLVNRSDSAASALLTLYNGSGAYVASKETAGVGGCGEKGSCLGCCRAKHAPAFEQFSPQT